MSEIILIDARGPVWSWDLQIDLACLRWLCRAWLRGSPRAAGRGRFQTPPVVVQSPNADAVRRYIARRRLMV